MMRMRVIWSAHITALRERCGAMLREERAPIDWLRHLCVALLLCVLFGCIYAALAARDVMCGDGGELIKAAIENSLIHPPGAPLWILLGHLFLALPVGSLPYRVNLSAALYHALTVGVVYLSSVLLLRRTLPALAAALLLGLSSPLFFIWSLQAELFSLNDLFAALVVFIALLSLRAPEYRRSLLPIGGALFGLGFANQQTLIFLGPLALYCARKALAPTSRSLIEACTLLRSDGAALRTVMWTGILLLLGWLLPYAHVVSVSYGQTSWHLGAVHNVPEFLALLDREMYGSFALAPGNPALIGGSLWNIVALLSGAGTALLLALALGLVVMVLGDARDGVRIVESICLFPIFFFVLLTNITIHGSDMQVYYQRFGLLPLSALAPFAAYAFLVPNFFVRSRAWRSWIVLVAIVAIVLGSIPTLPHRSLAAIHDQRRYVLDTFAALPRDAIFIAFGDELAQAMPYFQAIEHQRRDVTVVTYGLLGLPAYVASMHDLFALPARLPRRNAEILDLLAANRSNRRLFVSAPISGIRTVDVSYGIVYELVPRWQRIDLRQHYRQEVALESRDGYGTFSGDLLRSNGFLPSVRRYYAYGFQRTSQDAASLRRLPIK